MPFLPFVNYMQYNDYGHYPDQPAANPLKEDQRKFIIIPNTVYCISPDGFTFSVFRSISACTVFGKYQQKINCQQQNPEHSQNILQNFYGLHRGNSIFVYIRFIGISKNLIIGL